MKKFFSILVLLFAFPAIAEVAPIYEEEIIEETEEIETMPEQPKKPVVHIVNPAMTANRAASNPRATSRNTATGGGSRAVSARTAVTQTVRGVQNTRSPAARPISSRTAAIQNRAMIQSRATSRSQTMANTITAGAASQAAANENKTVQARAGTLYNSARVGTTGTVMSSGGRGVGTRASVSSNIPMLFNSAPSSAPAAPSSADNEELAAQTEFCKAQYSSCMDNFCNVLDDNQGRCSCSSNTTRYEKTEAALKQATTDLQDIATKIKYLGLSKDEVQSLFTMTAAEEAMRGTSDSSDLKGNLDKIQKLLIDPSSGTVTSGSVLSLDLNSFDFNNGFDLNSFMNEGATIGNQRGAALFETAKSRCANIITDCRKQKVDQSLVTANYDLEIDKQCIAYERALTDSNDQMKTTIRNATTVLQQARLMVAQNKNKYDLKGCVTALDACMLDDFVCGDDYRNCLDKTGQYIVGGDIIIGSKPVPGIKENWKFGSSYAFADNKSVSDMVESLLPPDETGPSADTNLARLLFDKIGIIDNDGRSVGMCSSILNQCQNYTFRANAYQQNNNVVKEYLLRTLTKIKAKQDDILTSYGESCKQDIVSCFAKNGGNSAGAGTKLTTAIQACKSYIDTCASINEITVFSEDVSVYVCPKENNKQMLLDAASYNCMATALACTAGGGMWVSGACTCPIGKELVGTSTCVACANGTQCNCPIGQTWDSATTACI